MGNTRGNRCFVFVLWLFVTWAGCVFAHPEKSAFVELNWLDGTPRLLIRVDLKEAESEPNEVVPWEYTHAWLKALTGAEAEAAYARIISRANFTVQITSRGTFHPNSAKLSEALADPDFLNAQEGHVLVTFVTDDLTGVVSLASPANLGKPLIISIRPPAPRSTLVETLAPGQHSADYPLLAAAWREFDPTPSPEKLLAQGCVDGFQNILLLKKPGIGLIEMLFFIILLLGHFLRRLWVVMTLILMIEVFHQYVVTYIDHHWDIYFYGRLAGATIATLLIWLCLFGLSKLFRPFLPQRLKTVRRYIYLHEKTETKSDSQENIDK